MEMRVHYREIAIGYFGRRFAVKDYVMPTGEVEGTRMI